MIVAKVVKWYRLEFGDLYKVECVDAFFCAPPGDEARRKVLSNRLHVATWLFSSLTLAEEFARYIEGQLVYLHPKTGLPVV